MTATLRASRRFHYIALLSNGALWLWMQDEMIRDRIVVGIQDAALSEKLQLETDLSLESAIAKVRQSKLIKQQQPTVMNRR